MDLTILVPTKNRHFHLKRLLNYYRDFQFNGFIIIFDSSDLAIFKKNKNLVKKLNNKKITIIKYNALPFQCFKNYQNLIKTNFVCYSGDDDFFIVTGLEKSVIELNNNNNIIGINGISYVMKLIGSDYNIISSISIYKNFYSMKNSSIGRINDMMKTYGVPLFSVFKTEKFKKMLNIVPSKNKIKLCPSRSIKDELLESFHLAFLGKINNKKFPFLIRTVSDLKKGYKHELEEKGIEKSYDFLMTSILKKIKDQQKALKTKKNFKNFFSNRVKGFILKKNNRKQNKNFFISTNNYFTICLKNIYTKLKIINYSNNTNFNSFYKVSKWLKKN